MSWFDRVRAGAVAGTVAGLLLSMNGGLTPAHAAGATVDWKGALSGLADDGYSLRSAAAKQRLPQSLPATALDNLGQRRVGAVVADAGTRYVDGVRFASDADGRAAYGDDAQLASWLGSRMASGATAGQVSAASDLIMAARLSADAAIQDAQSALRLEDGSDPAVTIAEAEEPSRVKDAEAGVDALAKIAGVGIPGGREAALRELGLARHDLALADAALSKALPVAGVTHAGLAWRHAFNALGHLGITYDGDRDGDEVVDRLEMTMGSSPLRADTDGDGLTDRFEIEELTGASLPALADTDGDGVRDGQEDADGDGLPALGEQTAGTSPTEADSDRDRSDDAAELRLGTKPTVPDTDADGLLDGVEPSTGTDALDRDTDADDVRDGDDVLRQQVKGAAGISATLVGVGDLVSSFRVRPTTSDDRVVGAPGQVGHAYDFSLSPPAGTGLRQAELAVPYDPAALAGASPADLRLFYFDESHGMWKLAADGQEVDTDRHVVRATVSHFSTYAIFDIKNWDETWSAQDNPCRSRSDGGTDVVLLDLALVLDSSGSMSWNDPLGLRRTAAKSFVDALLPDDRAGVVDFDDWAYVSQPLTSDHAAVKRAIDGIDDWGGTNIAAGVSLGNDLLIHNGDPTRARMAILLTDGEGYYDPRLTEQAKANGIAIYTIGLGSFVDEALLSRIATDTGGKYHQVDSAEGLPEVFRRISEDSGGDPRAAKDTDGDGLNDCVEIEGVLGGDLKTYTSDPTLPDTDGDGLEDGEELGVPAYGEELGGWFDLFAPALPPGTVVYDVFSDPRAVDSDGDGLDDPQEADLELRPRDSDTDSDGLSDGTEVDVVGSVPTVYDTDGDGHRDGYEVDHRDDQGLDPLFYDETVSKFSYVTDFTKGVIAGDLWRDDSLAWLAGNLTSGASSFIPVYGWIVGGVADIRDTIGSAIHADWVGSGLSLVGVIPYAGDAVSIPGKAAKFVLRNPELADEALAFIAKLDDVPSDIKVRAAKEILGSNWDLLRNAGFSETTLTTLEKGRTDLDELAQAVTRSGHRAGATATFFAKGKDGEVFLEGLYGAATKGVDKQVWASTKDFLGKGRYFDVLVARIAHESKVGFVKWSTKIENQIRKDAHLVDTGEIAGAHWHFFASSASNTIGADKRLLDLLDELRIPYTVHIP